MLKNLREIFVSNIKALEILYILEDVKPAARIMVKDEDREKVFSFFKENGLKYDVSGFKVIKQEEDKAYSDKGIKVSIDSIEKGYFFVYVSKDEMKTLEAKRLEEEGRHKELGLALGYPLCCAEFFEEHFEEESKKNNDFTLRTLKKSDGFEFSFFSNIAARHFDLALLNHFPCNFNCEKSVEMAEKHLEVIEKHDKEMADVIIGMLKGAIIYTETEGVFLLRRPILEHNRLYYKGVMGTGSNQLSESLKNAEYIEMLSKSRIRLNRLELKNLGVMLFS